MSTVTCPVCAAQYLATTPRCAECGAGLGAGDPIDLGDEVVAYDLGDWGPVQRAELSTGLAGEGVAHQWEAHELVVAESEADLVEELIDEIDNPDALEVDDSDDEGGADVLSALYVASDVLVGAPHQPASVAQVTEAAARAATIAVPYGLDGATWAEVRRRADALVGLLAAPADEEEVGAAARSLRDSVRPLV